MLRRSLFYIMFGAVLLFAGGGLAIHSLSMPAKAWLSVHLMDYAWDRTLSGENYARPWPWMDSAPVARLSVPRLNKDMVIMRGNSGAVMAFAPGWHEGTAVPGHTGISLISAHRDTHFGFLRQLKTGETLTLTDKDGTMHYYRVDEFVTTTKPEIRVDIEQGGEVLLLSTCYPFNNWTRSSDMRFIVVARKYKNASVS